MTPRRSLSALVVTLERSATRVIASFRFEV
jgi:hypothetical protein